ncbi:hypothetical protein GJS40_13680 [Aliibacillus thermotolerans]|nr:hypothetical protein [Aliibacillus thermotolerans]
MADELLKQSGTLEAREQTVEWSMDFNDMEKERSITILVKNTAIEYEIMMIIVKLRRLLSDDEKY